VTKFEVGLLLLLGLTAYGVLRIGDKLNILQRDIAEIWKRMKRLD
jgi:hypothetical protein